MRNPVALAILAAGLALFVIAVLGGALGAAFGLGFLGAPLAHIQVPAESITSKPVVGDFYITNTMVATWITIVVLLLLALRVSRGLSEVPGRLQCLVEIVIEFFLNLAESIAGRERARRFFPLVMTIFLFIVTANWLGILPGFGTIGRVETIDEVVHHKEEKGEHVDKSHLHVSVFEGDGSLAYMGFGSVDEDVTAEEWEEHPPERQTGRDSGPVLPQREHRHQHDSRDCNRRHGYGALLGIQRTRNRSASGQVLQLHAGTDPVLRGNTGSYLRGSEGHQLHVPSFRKHIRGRGAACGDDIPDPADRHHPVSGSGAVRRRDSGFHILNADARFRFGGDGQPQRRAPLVGKPSARTVLPRKWKR